MQGSGGVPTQMSGIITIITKTAPSCRCLRVQVCTRETCSCSSAFPHDGGSPSAVASAPSRLLKGLPGPSAAACCLQHYCVGVKSMVAGGGVCCCVQWSALQALQLLDRLSALSGGQRFYVWPASLASSFGFWVIFGVPLDPKTLVLHAPCLDGVD